ELGGDAGRPLGGGLHGRGTPVLPRGRGAAVGEHADPLGQQRPGGLAPGNEVPHRVVHLESGAGGSPGELRPRRQPGPRPAGRRRGAEPGGGSPPAMTPIAAPPSRLSCSSVSSVWVKNRVSSCSTAS